MPKILYLSVDFKTYKGKDWFEFVVAVDDAASNRNGFKLHYEYNSDTISWNLV